MAVGGQHAVLVTRNGKLYEWGAGVGGRLLAGSEATSPERVPTLWTRRRVFDGLWRTGSQRRVRGVFSSGALTFIALARRPADSMGRFDKLEPWVCSQKQLLRQT